MRRPRSPDVLIMGVIVGFGQQPEINFKIEGLHQAALGFRLTRVIRNLSQTGSGCIPKDRFYLRVSSAC